MNQYIGTDDQHHQLTDITTHPTDVVVKDEPWSVAGLDMSLLPPVSGDTVSLVHHMSPFPVPPPTVTTASQPDTIRTSVSPMIVSPSVSNLNTPRVSLSSVHSEFSSKIRSNHSSLETSPHASPLGFMEHGAAGGIGVGGFGHTIGGAGHQDLGVAICMDTHDDTGCITPPRSGYSSPQQEDAYSSQHASLSSYDHSLQSYQVIFLFLIHFLIL